MSDTIQPIPGPVSRPRRGRTWRTLAAIVVVVLLAIGLALLLARCASNPGGAGGAGGRGGRRPSITVGTAQATLGDVPITVTALGTVTPEATVSVTARVGGVIQSVNF